jgi:hypothetical protein
LSRKDASRLIDFLIDYLDTLDSDPDLEDGGDAEPWLGWLASGAIGGVSDCEEQCDDEGDQSDTGIGDSDGLLEQAGISNPVSVMEYARAVI